MVADMSVPLSTPRAALPACLPARRCLRAGSGGRHSAAAGGAADASWLDTPLGSLGKRFCANAKYVPATCVQRALCGAPAHVFARMRPTVAEPWLFLGVNLEKLSVFL